MAAATLVAQDPMPDFDAGPLSWVQPEIDAALARGLAALGEYAGAPDQSTALKHARNHVHQAAGALQLVGLDAVVAFVDEIERHLARLDDVAPAQLAQTCSVIDGACRKLQMFLEELVNGAEPVSLKLFPEYEAMQRARGVRAAAPTDLFFPDTTDAPRFSRAVVPAANLPSYLVKQRRAYQRGLLAWLRGDEDGARQMRDAVAAIEAATSQTHLRAFWWSTTALLDALVERGLDASFGVKQLAARVDLQIRRIAEGSAKVADRLRREVLYFVAISAPVAPSVMQVQRTYKLAGLIPSAEVLSSDLVRLQPHLREARDLLAAAKEAWLKCTSGRAENLPKLKQTLASVHRHAAETGNGALLKLTHALVARLEGLSPGNVSDPVAMEFATAMLLAESAFENYAKLSPEFPHHVDVMLARLDAAQASKPFEGGEATGMLDEMGKRAQDRLLLAQVGREIQANLRHMEQVLDGFFRDHGKRAELASLAKDSRQIRGALRMLGLDTAEALLASCEEQIESYGDPAAEITDDALELLAESLSGLGFYIEAVEQQRADHERLIAPLLARRRGEVAPEPAAAEDSVEVAVRELREALPALVNEMHRVPSDAAAREALKNKLGVLRDDAELIGDAELVAQAKAALRELEQGAAGTAIAAIAESAAPAPEAPQVSAETQRLLASTDHALDAELLDVFLTEAAEVLDTVAEHRRILEHNPGDREALRTVRRQFHTLKGSGRMVGLAELGEIAYEVEKIHNRLLEEERPVTPAVLAMIASGETHFRGWVAELKTHGAVLPDPEHLHDTIRRVEDELPRDRESVLRPRVAAPVAREVPRVEPTSTPAPLEIEAPDAEVPTAEPALESDALAAVAPVESPLDISDIDLSFLDESVAPEPDEAQGAKDLIPIDEPFELEAATEPALEPELDHREPAEVVDEEEFSAADALASVFAAYEHVRNEERAAIFGQAPREPHAPEPALLEPESATSIDAPAWAPVDDLPELGAPAETDTSPLVAMDLLAEAPTSELPALEPVSETASPVSSAEDMRFDFLMFPDEPTSPIEVVAANESSAEATLSQAPWDPDAEALDDMVEEPIAEDDSPSAGDLAALVEEASAPRLTLVHSADVPREEAVSAEASSEQPAPVLHAIELDWDVEPEPAQPAETASGDVETHDSAPTEHAQTLAPPPDFAESAPALVDELTVGDVILPRGLYDILTAEADDHLATLAHELELLTFDPSHELSEEVVRASHTLCGIHRAGGFVPVATTAKALEHCLSALRERAEPLPESAHALLAQALQSLTTLVARIKAHAPFSAADLVQAEEVQQRLDALRLEAWAVAAQVRAAAADETPSPASSVGMTAVPEIELATDDALEEALAAPLDDAILEALAGSTEDALDGDAEAVPTPVEPFPAASDVVLEPPFPSEAVARFQGIESHTADASESAPEAPAARVESPLTAIADEVDEQLLPIFLEEAEELFPQAGEDLRAWRRHPGDTGPASRLRRTLHTFKGSARMAGAMRLGELAHRMESRLLSGEDLLAGTPALFEALDTDLDRIAFVLDALRTGRTNVDVPWPETPLFAPAAVAATGAEAARGDEAEVAEDARASAAGSSDAETSPRVAPERESAGADLEVRDRAMLRVRADVVDRLVNEAGEVSITRARVDGEMRALKANLLELTSSVIRMRAQVREIEIQAESQIQSHLTLRNEASAEFDPLEFDRFTRFQELTRSLAEGVNDVSTVQQSLLRNVDEAEAALVAQARLLRDVQQQLFAVRTVPFGSVSERLYRVLRQVAKELDKRVDLEIRGSQVELDRSVLEKLAGPLEHLLRNAIDHGIESAEARARSGKPSMGEIVLTVRQVGNEIAIEIADDGAGLDLERIRARAVAQGRFASDARPTEPQLIDCIFQHGFSTAAKVTSVSGRGIGMDVVRSEIAALGGRVEVGTRPGRGTNFLLYLPLTLAVAQAVLVRAGGRVWALPAAMVEQVQQVKAEALVELYRSRCVHWQSRDYPFHYLPRLLAELQHAPVPGRSNPILLLRTAQGTAAIHVDEMVGNQEVVVKNIGPQLARVSGIAGATVLGTGEIVLIINPVQLAHRADVPRLDFDGEDRVVPSSHGAVEPAAGPPLALIVDDSLTVRKITSRLLTREGFAVETAKDGMEALQRLDERTPDVILLDIEMPRMDGFEFTKTIKADPRHAHIPIVMITSRTAEKHRSRAKDLGVDLYLGKPYQEEELLRHLHDMLSVAA